MSDLAVVILCLNEADHLGEFLPSIAAVEKELGVSCETVVIDRASTDGSADVARRFGARVIVSGPGYGNALRMAFEHVEAPYIVTLDANFSHPPAIVKYLFDQREQAEIVVASRYAPGGHCDEPWFRRWPSRWLNAVSRFLLTLPVRDTTSGFRLYNREAISRLRIEHSTYAALQEVLTKAYCEGYRIVEIPFHYRPRRRSHVRLARVARDYILVLWQMWKVRNSIRSADYDTRAFHSRILFQSWWQRRRYRTILGYVANRLKVLDVGCGSTEILNGAPQAVGLDISRAKLRFMRRPGRRLVHAGANDLPFPSESFEVVICSQVIEHLPAETNAIPELVRVLKPGGSLILGTPDYGSWQWPLIEKIYDFVNPSGYAEEHITHYTRAGLFAEIESLGLRIEDHTYICRGELIVHAHKPEQSSSRTTPA